MSLRWQGKSLTFGVLVFMRACTWYVLGSPGRFKPERPGVPDVDGALAPDVEDDAVGDLFAAAEEVEATGLVEESSSVGK